ncbi:hypothetical protein POTOM_059238 [Populus tomentosa]|uniref:Uncharacterized protein n=1 Tax=Populus tomentosa TaxID=118781 RepID=A0A8X7Y1Z9_POPTO|nr:hypothetical protein POTOM_059238 [Populus tomentosa]
MKRRKNQGLKESLYMVCKRTVNGCDFTEDPYENVIRELLICSLRTYVYEGVRDTSLPNTFVVDIGQLVNADIVLTTYDVLKEDLSHDSGRHILRFQKRGVGVLLVGKSCALWTGYTSMTIFSVLEQNKDSTGELIRKIEEAVSGTLNNSRSSRIASRYVSQLPVYLDEYEARLFRLNKLHGGIITSAEEAVNLQKRNSERNRYYWNLDRQKNNLLSSSDFNEESKKRKT